MKMNAMLHLAPASSKVSASRRRTDPGITPGSAYLRRWIARQAARHHDLLLTVAAARTAVAVSTAR